MSGRVDIPIGTILLANTRKEQLKDDFFRVLERRLYGTLFPLIGAERHQYEQIRVPTVELVEHSDDWLMGFDRDGVLDTGIPGEKRVGYAARISPAVRLEYRKFEKDGMRIGDGFEESDEDYYEDEHLVEVNKVHIVSTRRDQPAQLFEVDMNPTISSNNPDGILNSLWRDSAEPITPRAIVSKYRIAELPQTFMYTARRIEDEIQSME